MRRWIGQTWILMLRMLDPRQKWVLMMRFPTVEQIKGKHFTRLWREAKRWLKLVDSMTKRISVMAHGKTLEDARGEHGKKGEFAQTSPKFRNGCSQGEVVFDGLLQQRGTSEGKAIQWYTCYNSHPPVTGQTDDRYCRWSRFDSKSVAWFCMAFALSLTLDPMSGIHSHKTSGNAQLFQLLKGNWKHFFFARNLRSS